MQNYLPLLIVAVIALIAVIYFVRRLSRKNRTHDVIFNYNQNPSNPNLSRRSSDSPSYTGVTDYSSSVIATPSTSSDVGAISSSFSGGGDFSGGGSSGDSGSSGGGDGGGGGGGD